MQPPQERSIGEWMTPNGRTRTAERLPHSHRLPLSLRLDSHTNGSSV